MNFILALYSNACQLTYSLIGPLAMARRVLLIRSILLSRSFPGIGSLVFSGTQHGVRGPYDVMTVLDALNKNIFTSKSVKKRPSIGFFEFIGKFINFLLNLVSNFEVYINYCMLRKIFKNNGSWVMCENLGESDCKIFSILIPVGNFWCSIHWRIF